MSNFISIEVPFEPSQKAKELAAQAWCTSRTKHIEMDTELCLAFASIIHKLQEQTLEFVTNDELLEQLRYRLTNFADHA